MHGRFAPPVFPTPPHRLTVDRDEQAGGVARQCLRPRIEALLECQRIAHGNNAVKRAM